MKKLVLKSVCMAVVGSMLLTFNSSCSSKKSSDTTASASNDSIVEIGILHSLSATMAI